MKIAVVRAFLFKYTKIDVGWGFPYSAPADLIAGFKGLFHGSRHWRGGEEVRKKETGRGRKGT